jgi:hypothetical protein
MKRKHIYKTGIVAILIGCLGFLGSSVMAGSRDAKFARILMEDLLAQEINGQAFSVNVTDSFLVVDQTKVYVVENIKLKSGETISTEITDENGNRLPLSQIKNYQRVKVKAYTSEDGCTIASKIQRLKNKPEDPKGPSGIPQ